jgi:uncharacterized protein YndB with AHSA1/START domain
MMELTFSVQTKIQKPVSEVFDAVYNPRKLSGYFTTDSDGPLDEGKTAMWTFGDVAGQTIAFPVRVKKTVPNKLIRFAWEASEGVYDAKTGKLPQPAGLLSELLWLDAHELLPEGIPAARNSSSEGVFLGRISAHVLYRFPFACEPRPAFFGAAVLLLVVAGFFAATGFFAAVRSRTESSLPNSLGT